MMVARTVGAEEAANWLNGNIDDTGLADSTGAVLWVDNVQSLPQFFAILRHIPAEPPALVWKACHPGTVFRGAPLHHTEPDGSTRWSATKAQNPNLWARLVRVCKACQ
jgi:hypothetical protein